MHDVSPVEQYGRAPGTSGENPWKTGEKRGRSQGDTVEKLWKPMLTTITKKHTHKDKQKHEKHGKQKPHTKKKQQHKQENT